MNWQHLAAAVGVLLVANVGDMAIGQWRLGIIRESQMILMERYFAQQEQISALEKALTISEVLRKCARDVNLCKEGN